MSERFDALFELFKKFSRSLGRLDILLNNNVPFTTQSWQITVEILIALLDAIALAKKTIEEGRVGEYDKFSLGLRLRISGPGNLVKTLLRNKDISEALMNLDKLVTELSLTIQSQMLQFTFETVTLLNSSWFKPLLSLKLCSDSLC
jgi:hypothetical protein